MSLQKGSRAGRGSPDLEEGGQCVTVTCYPSESEPVRGQDASSNRHGTLCTATAHIVNAIIGAGLLGLPHAVAWLGFVAGLLVLVVFYLVDLLTATLLACVHETGGVRHRRYSQAVRAILGRNAEAALAAVQYIDLVLSGPILTIVAGQSGRAILDMVHCSRQTAEGGCGNKVWWPMAVFGGMQLLASQVRDLDAAWWVSTIGATMVVGYSLVSLGLGISKAGNNCGTVGGISASAVDKAFGVMNSLGSVAFAFGFATVLIEIQDTVREPPPAKRTMVRAIFISVHTALLLYLGVAITGYMSFGNEVPDSFLTTEGLGPAWVIVWANSMVYIHMLAGFQVFSQPVFASCEALLRRWLPHSIGKLSERVLMLGFRSAYVFIITIVSCIMPFFSEIAGLMGAVVFWPTAVCLPILLYVKVYPVSRWRRVALQTINGVMLVVALLGVIGSLRNIILHASSYAVFS